MKQCLVTGSDLDPQMTRRRVGTPFVPNPMPQIMWFSEPFFRDGTTADQTYMAGQFAKTYEKLVEMAGDIWLDPEAALAGMRAEDFKAAETAPFVYGGLLDKPERYGALKDEGAADRLRAFLATALLGDLLSKWANNRVRVEMLFQRWDREAEAEAKAEVTPPAGE